MEKAEVVVNISAVVSAMWFRWAIDLFFAEPKPDFAADFSPVRYTGGDPRFQAGALDVERYVTFKY